MTESGLVFRGVKPLFRLGAAAKYLVLDNPISEIARAKRAPSSLRAIPPDAWPGDAQHGRDMVAGIFRFAGQTISREQLSWEPEGVFPEWVAALHSFEWLRNLRSVSGDKARRMAREMVALWINQYPAFNEKTWRADITGPRLASWIAFHDFFCATADENFRKNYFASLDRQARHLSRALPGDLAGIPLMRALRGLAYTGLALEGGENRLEQAFRLILKQIPQQILADGGHISRNPRATFEFLQCLVDLRAALIAARMEMPEEIQHAIDRIAPAVKFFRHGDGGLAQFNGGQEGNPHLLEATLMHSGARGRAMGSLPQCGYERLNLGRSSIIMDTGLPQLSTYSGRAHCGPLSFEYSYGRDRVIVNCGTSEVDGKWQKVLRSTLAHSTLIVDNRNSCKFDKSGLLLNRPEVAVHRQEKEETALLEGGHDGYVARFGLTYNRTLQLREQGDLLRGEEKLAGRAGVPFAVRFHLHPGIHAELSADGGEILLCARSGISWRFKVKGAAMTIEESVYVAEDENPQPSLQIVLSGQTLDGITTVSWDMLREKI